MPVGSWWKTEMFQTNSLFPLCVSLLSHSSTLTLLTPGVRASPHHTILRHQLGVLQFNSILTLSTRRWRRAHRLRARPYKAAPQLRCLQGCPPAQVPTASSRSQLTLCLCLVWLKVRGSFSPGISLFARTAHRTQGNTYVSQLLKDMIKVEPGEEVRR